MSSNNDPKDERIAPRQPRTEENPAAAAPRKPRAGLVAALALAALLLAGGCLLGAHACTPQEQPQATTSPAGQDTQDEQGVQAEDKSAGKAGEVGEADPENAAASSSAEKAGTSSGTGAGSSPSPSKGGASAGASKPSGGRSSTSSGKDQQPAAITVSIAIDASRAGEAYASCGMPQRPLELPEGSTAYDALLAIASSVGGNSTYVSSINGLAEKQGGPLSGWMYSVNGEYPQVSCGYCELHAGDELLWAYTCNLGEDL